MIELFMLALCFATPADSLMIYSGGRRELLLPLSEARTIPIPDPWIVPETIQCLLDSLKLAADEDFFWSDSLRAVVILYPQASVGDSIRIRWRSAQVSDKLTFSYYRPSEPQETAGDSQPPDRAAGRDFGAGALMTTGSITRGVQFGDGGGVTSGLHFEARGSPAPGVEVEAVVDDRDVPVSGESGGSAALSELDRLLLWISTEDVSAELGDMDILWREGRYGRIDRRLKGGRLAARTGGMEWEAAAAGNDDRYRRVVISGRAGDLGPYELTDAAGGGVAVRAGTETVWLDGRRLTSGRSEDYVIDNGRGRLSFNPGVVIRDDSRIEIEYRHSDDSYAGRFFSGRWSSVLGDRGSLQLKYASDGVDARAPQAFELSDSARRALSAAGDDAGAAEVSGIDSVGIGGGDYIWADTLGIPIVRFSAPDSLGRPTGYLAVDFRRDSRGDYRRDYDAALSLFRFAWVGSGNGGWSPTRVLPLPQRTELIALHFVARSDRINIGVEAAVTNADKNLLSGRDDGDNIGAAWTIAGGFNDDDPAAVVFGSASIQRREAAFNPLTSDRDPDYAYTWNRAADETATETAASARLGMRPFKRLTLTVGGGLLRADQGKRSLRGETAADWAGEAWTASAAASRVSAETDSGAPTTGAEFRGRIVRLAGLLRPEYAYQTEDRRESVGGGRRRYAQHSPALSLRLSPRHQLNLGLQYRDNAAGLRGASTGRTVTAAYSGSGGVGSLLLKGQRYLETFAAPDIEAVKMTAVNLNAALTPRSSGWRGSLAWDATSGNDRAGVWVARYVGTGRGAYRLEGGRYAPDPDGEFDLNLLPTDSLERITQVKTNLRAEWAHRRGYGAPRLGATSYYLNYDAALTASAKESAAELLLLPKAYLKSSLHSGRRLVQQDVGFAEGMGASDGRLILRWDERRDRALRGGEGTDARSATLRIRTQLREGLRTRMQPSTSRERRWALQRGTELTAIRTVGIDNELQQSLTPRIQSGLEFAYSARRDAVSGDRVDERRWKPWLSLTLSGSGALRSELEYTRLSATSQTPVFDLLKGMALGDNLTLYASIEHRINDTFQLGASLRSRWRGKLKPRHDGVAQMTATF